MTLLAEAPDIEDVVPTTDLDALGDDDFEHAFRQFLVAKRAMAARELRFLDVARRRGSHVRHGFRDTAAWVAWLAGERPGAVRHDVALAEQVAATPVVAAAVAAGAVSKTQAGQLVAARDLPVEVQERLVERADVLSVRQLGQVVREAQYDHGIVPTDPLPACQLTQTDTGGTLTATVDAEGYEIVETALRTVVDQLGLPELPYEQRRAAALVATCRHYLEFNENPVRERTGGHAHAPRCATTTPRPGPTAPGRRWTGAGARRTGRQDAAGDTVAAARASSRRGPRRVATDGRRASGRGERDGWRPGDPRGPHRRRHGPARLRG